MLKLKFTQLRLLLVLNIIAVIVYNIGFIIDIETTKSGIFLSGAIIVIDFITLVSVLRQRNIDDFKEGNKEKK